MDLSIKQEIVMLDGATICEGMSAFNNLIYGGHGFCSFSNYSYSVKLEICCESLEEVADVRKLVGKYLSSSWVEECQEYDMSGTPYWWLKFTYSKSSRC